MIRSDKLQVYFDGKIQRELFIYTPHSQKELDDYLSQFRDKPCYEVYINGQLYDVGD